MRERQSNKTVGKRLERVLYQKGKRSSNGQGVFEKMKIKNTMKCYYTPSRMFKF